VFDRGATPTRRIGALAEAAPRRRSGVLLCTDVRDTQELRKGSLMPGSKRRGGGGRARRAPRPPGRRPGRGCRRRARSRNASVAINRSGQGSQVVARRSASPRGRGGRRRRHRGRRIYGKAKARMHGPLARASRRPRSTSSRFCRESPRHPAPDPGRGRARVCCGAAQAGSPGEPALHRAARARVLDVARDPRRAVEVARPSDNDQHPCHATVAALRRAGPSGG